MLTTLEWILLALAAIAFFTYRLSRWQSVEPAKLAKMPVIFGIVGAVSLAGSAHQLAGAHVHLRDVTILAVELVVGAGVGLLIGRLTQIKTFPDGVRSRLVGPGIAVFLSFIAVRIGLGVLAGVLGASVAALPALTFLVLSVIKGVQGLVVHQRVVQHRQIEQQQAYAEVWR